MLSTIILLYALNAANPIPTACFVFAYIFFFLELIYRLIRLIMVIKDSIEAKEVNKAIIRVLRNQHKNSP